MYGHMVYILRVYLSLKYLYCSNIFSVFTSAKVLARNTMKQNGLCQGFELLSYILTRYVCCIGV